MRNARAFPLILFIIQLLFGVVAVATASTTAEDHVIEIPVPITRADGSRGYAQIGYMPNATVAGVQPPSHLELVVLGDGNVGLNGERWTISGKMQIERGWLFSNGEFKGSLFTEGSVSEEPFKSWSAVGGGFYAYVPVIQGDVSTDEASSIRFYWDELSAAVQSTFTIQRSYLQLAPSVYNPTGRLFKARAVPVGPNIDAPAAFERGGRYLISGIVWEDFNQNDVMDGDESGIANVLLRLRKGTYVTSDVVDTTSTGSDGYYEFAFDDDGQYFVELNQPLDTSFAAPNPPSDSVVTSQISGLKHNDVMATWPWETTVTSEVFSFTPSAPEQRVNAGLTYLPVITFNPNSMTVQEPTEESWKAVKVGIVADRDWESLLMLNYKFTGTTDNVVFGEDYEFPLLTNLLADRAGASAIVPFTVFRDAESEFLEGVWIEIDLSMSEVSSKSGRLYVNLTDPASLEEPPVVVGNITEMYTGFLGNGSGSPAILLRENGAYRMGVFVEAAETAFFANLVQDGDEYTFAADGVIGRGRFLNGVFEGLMSPGGSFLLEPVDAFGPFAEAAGLYFQEGVLGEDWDVYAALAPSGELLFYSEYEGEGVGGRMMVPPSGQIDVSVPVNAQFKGTVALQSPFLVQGLLTEMGEQYPLRLNRISALDPDLSGVLSFMVSGAKSMSGGWALQPWFGWFYIGDLNDRWVYHIEHGFLWVSGESFSDFWIYMPDFDSWVFTTPLDYPLLYSAKDGWLFYGVGTAGWAYDYSLQVWRKIGG